MAAMNLCRLVQLLLTPTLPEVFLLHLPSPPWEGAHSCTGLSPVALGGDMRGIELLARPTLLFLPLFIFFLPPSPSLSLSLLSPPPVKAFGDAARGFWKILLVV